MIGHLPQRVGNRVEIRYESGGGPLVAAFEVPPDVETAAGRAGVDATVAAGWLPAMARREVLTVDAPVSPRLRGGVARVAEIMLTWDRALHHDAPWYGPTALDAPLQAALPDRAQHRQDGTGAERAGDGRRVACFFTAGVDSLHSVLRRRDELDELIFVHGFDLLDDRSHPLNRSVSERLHDAAALIGLPLIELECNLVAFAAASGIGWDDYHGAAMATVAQLLAPRYSTVYVPATTTYDQLYPLGSHPLLDPLWSSEDVEIVHDGADATRVEKLRAIAEHPAAQRHLRVCCENRDDAYNCGSCEKCLRTAVGIRIAGCADAFGTLPQPSLRQVSDVEIRGLGSSWRSLLSELERRGDDRGLQLAIRSAFARRALRTRPVLRRIVR